jgi:hypothetical protein
VCPGFTLSLIFEAKDSASYFPLLMPANPTGLSKVSSSNDKFRQTGQGDRGQGRLLGRKFRLETVAAVLGRDSW